MKTIWKYSKCLLKTIGIFLLLCVAFLFAFIGLVIGFGVLYFRICADEIKENEN